MSRLSENRTVHKSSSSGSSSAEFSSDERRVLLGTAHESVLSAFTGGALEAPFPPHLSDPRGVFTTLYLDSDLRGCVGYALPVAPLYRAVWETARAAAFEDSRFFPVTEQDAPRLEVSLSVLSRLFPIQADQVEVGRHGLVISLGGRRGLLLPQVPVEYDWDRRTFIEQTCRKAGLPLDAWRKGATLEAFTAEVFGDGDLSA
jgi:AmmeMemoRadiSam system protein A